MDGTVTPTEFAVMLSGEPAPVRFMNTVWADRHGRYDGLTTVRDLRAWLDSTGTGTAGDHPPTAEELAQFRRLRDALRRLAGLVTADSRPVAVSTPAEIERAVTAVNAAAAHASAWPQLVYRDGELRGEVAGRAGPARRALAELAGQAVELLTGEHCTALRACYAPGCVLYFVKDHPRREWCSALCGNRARVARHYRRHHPSEQPG